MQPNTDGSKQLKPAFPNFSSAEEPMLMQKPDSMPQKKTLLSLPTGDRNPVQVMISILKLQNFKNQYSKFINKLNINCILNT